MNDSDDPEFQDELSGEEEANENAPVAVPGALTPAAWFCAGCGRPNETLVDLGSGYEQQYVEDCAVCCRHNLIKLVIDEESLRILLRNELEYE